MTTSGATPAAIIERLEALRGDDPIGIVCDGDGTLWMGDVGEDTFAHAVAKGAFRSEAADALERFARGYDVVPGKDATSTARAILDAFNAGEIPDLPICEAMTWCYAGLSEDQLRSLTREALRAAGMLARKQTLLEPIVSWARSQAASLVVVSASPKVVVEEAAGLLWGFAANEIIGARARVHGGVYAAEMDGPVPFGDRKRELAEAHFGAVSWLASFGDNFFDFEMLRAARLGVAVRPKRALRDRLSANDGIIVLDGGGEPAH
jgi:phosphoserine phosphatase